MKKNLTLILFLLIINITVKAQTQKGNQLLGGSVSFATSNGNNNYSDYNNSNYNYSSKSKMTSLGLGPVYSYFIADQLDLGVALGYGTSKTTFNYSVSNPNYSALPYKISNPSYLGGIYLRKYFLYKQKVGIRTGPFAEYQKYKYNSEYLAPQATNYNNNQSGNSISTGLLLDFVYFPNNRFGVFANLGAVSYSHINSGYQNSSSFENTKTDSFGLRLTTTLNLSLVYCLRK